MTAVVPVDQLLDQQTVDELRPPCECVYAHERDTAPPAAWIVWWVCVCPPAVHLACTACKDYVLATRNSLECEMCGQIWTPIAAGVRLIEPLNRRPA